MTSARWVAVAAAFMAVTTAAPRSVAAPLEARPQEGRDSETKLVPIVKVPPSTPLRDGMWKVEQEYGAVRFTGGPPLTFRRDRLETSAADAPPPPAPEDPASAAALLDPKSVPLLALPPLDEKPPSPSEKREAFQRETLPESPLLAGKESTVAAATPVDLAARTAPAASVRGGFPGAGEEMPPSELLPSVTAETPPPPEAFAPSSRPVPDASLRRGFAAPEEAATAPAGTPQEPSAKMDGFDRDYAELGSNAIPDLIKLLQQGSPKLRARAADELGRRGVEASSAVPALREALSDSNSRIKASAALALGNIGGDAAALRSLLTPLLGDRNPDVSMSAKTALSRLD